MPAPAGAITVLLPMYLAFLGVVALPTSIVAFYTVVIAMLMVSRLPVFSGKRAGSRVRRELVPPFVLFAVLFIVLLVSYPWHVLATGSILFLAALPLGWMSYRRQEQRAADAAALSPAAASPSAPPAMNAPPAPRDESDRPPRLN
jgi:CDP-diacylglycerol--serine O-phosphatidyltransferase